MLLVATQLLASSPGTPSSELFAMGGVGHLGLVLILFGLLALLILCRKRLVRLRQSRVLMAGTAAVVLSIELFSIVAAFPPGSGSAADRIPLHLCATLKLAIATLVLFERYDLVKFVSIWSIGAGFISFANLNLGGASFENFAFWHYLVGHYYLFALPLFLFLTGEFRYDLRFHLRSVLGLVVWSLAVFLVNWVFDTNYMYSGPHNQTAVAFLPARLMVWPLNYLAYLLTGAVLLSTIYGLLRIAQVRLTRRSGEGQCPPDEGLAGTPFRGNPRASGWLRWISAGTRDSSLTDVRFTRACGSFTATPLNYGALRPHPLEFKPLASPEVALEAGGFHLEGPNLVR